MNSIEPALRVRANAHAGPGAVAGGRIVRFTDPLPGPVDHAAIAPPCDGPMSLAARVRSTFRSNLAFHEACGQSASPQCLAIAVRLVIELARVTFETGEPGPARCPSPRVEHARCLEKVAVLMRALGAGWRPPAFELLHSLDTLIVLFVQIDTRSPCRQVGALDA